jgi:zinc transporter ZupT
MMILIESGFTIRKALLFNLFSACTAFVGFFIGVSISENEGARTWIFAIAAGTFTYIALVDLVSLYIFLLIISIV